VGHQHETRVALAQVVERRERGVDARVVRHLDLFVLPCERDVEIDSHQHLPTRHVGVPDGLLAEQERALRGGGDQKCPVSEAMAFLD
jgi:hypothetical protein